MRECSGRAAGFLVLSAFLFLLPQAASAAGFDDLLGDTIERAVKSEVQRKVDQETRKATRCAMGDEVCLERQRQQAAPSSAPAPAGTSGSSSTSGSPASGASAAASAAASPAAAPAPSAPSISIAAYPGSELVEEDDEAYGEFLRIVNVEKGEISTETLEGAYSHRKYKNPKGRSTLEIMRNYEEALAAQGFTADFECAKRDVCRSQHWSGVNGTNVGIGSDVRYVTGKMPTQAGTAYVSIAVNPNLTYIDIVETAEMQSGLVAIDANRLAEEIEKSGRVALQGIYFDTGLATLKPESFDAIAEVAGLMKNKPDWTIEVVGHTDSVGDEASNRQLSDERAAAVRSALVSRYGVDGARLTSRGAGESEPVADNATDAGRALNRRVELVKR
jgi:outer membrane protein OmpA-like peptidoglycan-associated protein